MNSSLENKKHIGEHITTYTGVWFYPLSPDSEALHIEDIAHALSLITRGNGHVKSFFSVGQHCINCAREAKARGLSDRLVLACLLHDASECYMSDVPRPFKKELPNYIEAEERLLNVIYEKFLGAALSTEECATVKEIDNAMLWYDMKNLLNEVISDKQPEIHIELSYAVRPFEEVEREYLEMARELIEV